MASTQKVEEKSQCSKMNQENQEKKSLLKTSLPLSMYSTADKWEKGDTVIKNHKIKIYPNLQQKKILHEWFGTYRFVYNQILK